MVKPNPQHDYYRDLEVPPKADPDEIKKQYFKLARLYHPDRNPGKVDEYTPKFQAIQEAHEVLSDPATKAKYDADRARLRTGVTAFKSSVGGPGRRSAYNAGYSEFPPPPRRTQQPPRNATSEFTAKPSTGANRFNAFRSAHQPQPAGATNDAASKASAWQRMSGMRPGAAAGAAADRQWDSEAETSKRTPRVPPRPGAFGRANTTRPPPMTAKSGFDPRATDGQFEPAVTGAANYYTETRNSDRPPPTTAKSDPRPASQTSEPEGIRINPVQPVRGARVRSGSNVPFTEGDERIAAPYRKSGGEKVKISTDDVKRSASVRDAPAYAQQGANFTPHSSTSSRHRSVSPPRGKFFEHPPHQMPGFTHMGARTAKEKMKAGDPRRFFDINYSDSSDESDVRSPNPAAPGAPPVSEPQSRNSPLFGERLKAQPRPPFSRLNSQQTDPNGSATPTAGAATPPVNGNGNAAPAGAPPIFNIPPDNPALRSPRFGEFRSRSEESINTKFSPGEWNGQFKGDAGYFSNAPTNAPDARLRRSPRGRQGPRAVSEAQSQPPSATATQPPTSIPGLGSMPPPPPPPQVQMQLRPNAPHFAPKPGDAKFTPEEWQQTMKDPSWIWTQEGAGSPSKAGSRKGSTSSTGSRTRLGSRTGPASRPPRTAPVAESNTDDAGSTTGYDGEESATSRNSDAMDIDEVPQVNGGGSTTQGQTPRVRNVSQQPQREDWWEKPSVDPTSPASAAGVSMGPPPVTVTAPTPGMSTASAPGTSSVAAPGLPTAAAPGTSAADTINMKGWNKVAPFGAETGAPGDGLTNVTDLGAGLPIPSAPSSSHPLKPSTPRTLELPYMPKSPDPPTGRATKTAWDAYVTGFARYMRAWFDVQKQMQSHFEVRRKELNHMMINATSKPGGMDAWLGKIGEAKDEIGLATYLRTLQEDERVREHWNVLCDSHREAVEAFAAAKERVGQSGLAEG